MAIYGVNWTDPMKESDLAKLPYEVSLRRLADNNPCLACSDRSMVSFKGRGGEVHIHGDQNHRRVFANLDAPNITADGRTMAPGTPFPVITQNGVDVIRGQILVYVPIYKHGADGQPSWDVSRTLEQQQLDKQRFMHKIGYSTRIDVLNTSSAESWCLVAATVHHHLNYPEINQFGIPKGKGRPLFNKKHGDQSEYGDPTYFDVGKPFQPGQKRSITLYPVQNKCDTTGVTLNQLRIVIRRSIGGWRIPSTNQWLNPAYFDIPLTVITIAFDPAPLYCPIDPAPPDFRTFPVLVQVRGIPSNTKPIGGYWRGSVIPVRRHSHIDISIKFQEPSNDYELGLSDDLKPRVLPSPMWSSCFCVFMLPDSGDPDLLRYRLHVLDTPFKRATVIVVLVFRHKDNANLTYRYYVVCDLKNSDVLSAEVLNDLPISIQQHLLAYPSISPRLINRFPYPEPATNGEPEERSRRKEAERGVLKDRYAPYEMPHRRTMALLCLGASDIDRKRTIDVLESAAKKDPRMKQYVNFGKRVSEIERFLKTPIVASNIPDFRRRALLTMQLEETEDRKELDSFGHTVRMEYEPPKPNIGNFYGQVGRFRISLAECPKWKGKLLFNGRRCLLSRPNDREAELAELKNDLMNSQRQLVEMEKEIQENAATITTIQFGEGTKSRMQHRIQVMRNEVIHLETACMEMTRKLEDMAAEKKNRMKRGRRDEWKDDDEASRSTINVEKHYFEANVVELDGDNVRLDFDITNLFGYKVLKAGDLITLRVEFLQDRKSVGYFNRSLSALLDAAIARYMFSPSVETYAVMKAGGSYKRTRLYIDYETTASSVGSQTMAISRILSSTGCGTLQLLEGPPGTGKTKTLVTSACLGVDLCKTPIDDEHPNRYETMDELLSRSPLLKKFPPMVVDPGTVNQGQQQAMPNDPENDLDIDDDFYEIDQVDEGDDGGKTMAELEGRSVPKEKDPIRYLIVAETNQAADHVAIELDAAGIEPKDLFRIMARNRRGLTKDMTRWSNVIWDEKKGLQVDAVRISRIKEARIVITTSANVAILHRRKLDIGKFCFVFVDEASQMSEMKFIVVLATGLQHAHDEFGLSVVLGGDVKQILPTLRHFGKYEDKGYNLLSDSTAYRLSTTVQYDPFDANRFTYLSFPLILNMRCHYTLGESYNVIRFGGKLKFYYTEENEYELVPEIFKKIYLHESSEVLCRVGRNYRGEIKMNGLRFVNVDGEERRGGYEVGTVAESLAILDGESTSMSNEAEARKVVELIIELLAADVLPEQIVVETYYLDQVGLIREMLAKNLGKKASLIRVDDADMLQGQESDVVIFSCVRTSPTSPLEFVKEAGRWTTGVSRAKWIMIVVGCTGVLQHADYWKPYLDDCNARRQIQNADGYSIELVRTENRMITRPQTASGGERMFAPSVPHQQQQQWGIGRGRPVSGLPIEQPQPLGGGARGVFLTPENQHPRIGSAGRGRGSM